MDADFRATWNKIPFVTRYVTLAAGVLLVLSIFSPAMSLQFWRTPNAPAWQVWRLVTAPLCYYGTAVGGIINLYMLATSVYELETTVFMTRARTAYYLVWVSLGFDLLGPRLSLYHYSAGLIGALAWTLAQENPHVQVTLLGFIPIPRRYFPLANVAMAVASTQSVEAAYEALLGIVLAHSFMFFTEILPQAGGPQYLAATPRVLGALDAMEQNTRAREQFGTGHRLSQPRWKLF